MTSIRTPYLAPEGRGHITPWLAVIHAVNRAEPDTFGSPQRIGVGSDYPGAYVEQYPDANVVLPVDDDNGTALIVSHTEKGARLLRAAARTLGLEVDQ